MQQASAAAMKTASALDTGAADSPVQYNQASASITGNKRLGRFTMRGQGKVDRLDYANARQSGTFIPINHADRNRTIGSASLQAGYDYQEGSNIYLRIEGIASDYHDKADDAGFDRDSHGVDLRVGANVDLGGVTSGGAYVGYRGQYYEDGGPAQLNESEVEALILGANVTSNITKLTTIHGRVERGVFESTLVGSPGGISNRVEIGADHELLRNLLLNANFSSRFFDFEGVDRDDFGLLLQFGATYLVNRHLTLDGGFEHERNRSDGSRQGIDNTSNRIMIRLTTQP
ncbi:MAG: outer membrane beta-barrel protein [Alphaproteobacteria bacterium]